MLKGKFTIEFIHDRLVIVLEQMNAISLRDLQGEIKNKEDLLEVVSQLGD